MYSSSDSLGKGNEAPSPTNCTRKEAPCKLIKSEQKEGGKGENFTHLTFLHFLLTVTKNKDI